MISGLFPFILFLCVIFGGVMAAIVSQFWLIVFAVLLVGVFVAIFYWRKNIFAAEVSFLFALIFIFAAWAHGARGHNIGQLCGKDRILKIKVVTVVRELGEFNVCWATVRGFNERVRILDYTRRFEYLGCYQIDGAISVRGYNGRALYSLWVKKGTAVGDVKCNFFENSIRKVSRYVLKGFKDNFNDLTYRFLSSLFLGRYELLHHERQIFINAGTTHLLAISGLHMVLAAATLFFILGLFGLTYPSRLVAASMMIFIYTFLSGINPSGLRAALMFAVCAASFFLRRTVCGLNVLGVAGLVSFFANPLVLSDIGFQLSYLSVFALIIFSKMFPAEKVRNVLVREFNQLFDTSLWVGLFILPLVSFYFGRIYILSFLYNILLIPLCNLILLITFVLVCLLPAKPLVFIIAAVLEPLSIWFIGLNKVLGDFPLSWIGFSFNLTGVIFYYIVFMVALGYYRYNKRYEKI